MLIILLSEDTIVLRKLALLSLSGLQHVPRKMTERAQATTLEPSQSGTREMTRRNERERGNAYRVRGRAQVLSSVCKMRDSLAGCALVGGPLCPPFTRLGIVHGAVPVELKPPCLPHRFPPRGSELFASLYASLCASRIADVIAKRYRTPSTRVPACPPSWHACSRGVCTLRRIASTARSVIILVHDVPPLIVSLFLSLSLSLSFSPSVSFVSRERRPLYVS